MKVFIRVPAKWRQQRPRDTVTQLRQETLPLTEAGAGWTACTSLLLFRDPRYVSECPVKF